MPSRAHDTAVKRTARELEADNWNVKADAGRWTTPGTIAGRRPDIIATKRGSRRIIEIELLGTNHDGQHETFRRHAAQKTNTVFFGYYVDEAGRRRKRFD